MPMDYAQYREEVREDIANVLKLAGCQPILFVGSGFSRRYADAPNWDELLKELAENCPKVDHPYAYYKQKFQDQPRIASMFAEAYREWAWDEGRANFPPEYFNEAFPTEVFLKHATAAMLHNLKPVHAGLKAELKALQAINPHAIVTTNYDELLEPLFPQYEAVVGQTILKQPYLSIGEIFKIHGSVADPLSLVLTHGDYEAFETDKKYLSAKLLTYFAEHPLLFIGYGASDPNIRSVLYDVDRMIRADFALIPNIYILEWDPAIDENSYPARDRVLAVGENREIRIKSISASSFEWVYEAFSSGGALEKVNMKLLRSLLARTIDLVRKDVPTKKVEIDFQTLEHKLQEGEGVATLLGITTIGDPAKVNLHFPFTLTEVAEQLGYQGWNAAHRLIALVEEQTGFDLKSSDNTYHITMRTGKSSSTNKYSQACVDLLRAVLNGEPYKLAEDCVVAAQKAA
ncbi:SIR2 family protein [Burkholderia ambifaria]|uniref:SIR2 family protein n=1 Tax=Burkholderia ambifaria TaxID=152480 RepID=UPI00158CDD95|nr:SIR2 family protein [Burkholderia ambifaria]